MGVEQISAIVVDVAFQIHREIGPGLLETVYEAVLAKRLRDRGLRVARQVSVPIQIDGIVLDEGFRADLLVEDSFVVELKSVEALAPVHPKQVRTYLRLLGLPVGLVINFGGALFKDGVRRVVNDHRDTSGSRLRINGGAGEESGSCEGARARSN